MLYTALIVALYGCEEYDARDAFSNCTSESHASDGSATLTVYDFLGWPTGIDVTTGETTVRSEVQYVLVAGRVVESLTLTGEVGVSRFYDGRENLESVVFLEDEEANYECTLAYDGKGLLQSSSCTNGTETTYDACGNPLTLTTADSVRSFGYAYSDCRILSVLAVGEDGGGGFSENTQYSFGRPVSWVREQNGQLQSEITDWDCPASL